MPKAIPPAGPSRASCWRTRNTCGLAACRAWSRRCCWRWRWRSPRSAPGWPWPRGRRTNVRTTRASAASRPRARPRGRATAKATRTAPRMTAACQHDEPDRVTLPFSRPACCRRRRCPPSAAGALVRTLRRRRYRRRRRPRDRVPASPTRRPPARLSGAPSCGRADAVRPLCGRSRPRPSRRLFDDPRDSIRTPAARNGGRGVLRGGRPRRSRP